MPDVVDEWPMAWSSGWLLERMMELESEPEKWKGQPVGLGDDDGEWQGASEPPAGFENLPWHGEQGEEVDFGE